MTLASRARNFRRDLKKRLGDGRMARLVEEGTQLHATLPMAEWQRKRIAEIRAVGEQKCREVEQASEMRKRQLVEDFMQFEIDFMLASNKFREHNPGEEWKPGGVWKAGFALRKFFKGLGHRAEAMSIPGYGDTKAQQ